MLQLGEKRDLKIFLFGHLLVFLVVAVTDVCDDAEKLAIVWFVLGFSQSHV
jgi:hypothetical protein